MLFHSGDYELVVRQQPKEALVAQPGKEKSKPAKSDFFYRCLPRLLQTENQ